METQEVIERLEKGLGIRFSETGSVNWVRCDRFLIIISKKLELLTLGDCGKTILIKKIDDLKDEHIQSYISLVKNMMDEQKHEDINQMLDNIKEYQKKINILLNKIEREMK